MGQMIGLNGCSCPLGSPRLGLEVFRKHVGMGWSSGNGVVQDSDYFSLE